MNATFEKNKALCLEAMEMENTKPISCMTGNTFAAVLAGVSPGEYMEDPVKGALAAIDTIKHIEEEAGEIICFNNNPQPMNMAAVMTFAWNSRILVPGIDLPTDSVYQVKEEELVGPEAYDQIMAMGYNNFLMANVIPRIVDMAYLGKYMGIAAQAAPQFAEIYAEWGKPTFMGGQSTGVPFEGLCGMRSLQPFYFDCYKMPDKVKAVSDFIYEENYATTEENLNNPQDPMALGSWVGGWRTASNMINPTIFENLVWPYMKRSAEQLINHGLIAVLHLDSDWNRDVEYFGVLPQNKIIFNTDGMTNLPRVRQLLPKAPQMGDVPPTLVSTGTPQQVTDYINRLIDQTGPEGMFITVACDTPVNAKFENMVAMVKATNEWK